MMTNAKQPAPRRFRGMHEAVMVVCAVAIFAPFASCRKGGDAAEGQKSFEGASVLLVTVDTTRADRIGCYGYVRAKTPTIDALARKGVLFADASTQAPLTLPAHVSLLTGAYCKQHGVHDNGRFVLPDGIPTLAEIFSAKGYDTAAFIGSVVLAKKFGLDRGFRLYNDDIGPIDQLAVTTEAQRPANKVTDDAVRWLGSRGAKPFFAWVHYYDPHKPYEPPPGWTPPGGTAYDGEIAFCDAQLKRLLSALSAKGLSDKTLVIVTSDHGESFGEHREEDHVMFLYETNLRIPLIFNMPGSIPEGGSVDTVVRITDVAPTLLDLFGWPQPESMTGESVAPALRGHAMEPRFSIAESYTGWYMFRWAKQRSITTVDWKFIDTTIPELFDRRTDRAEMRNLYSAKKDVAEQLRKQLHDFENSLEEIVAQAVDLTPAEIENIKSLGYLGGDSSSVSDETEPSTGLPGPKERYDDYLAAKRAHTLFTQCKFDEVIAIAQPLYQRNPQSSEVQYVLGCSYASVKQWEPARECLQAFVRDNPNSAAALTTLGTVFRSLNRLDDSIKTLEAALRVDPDFIEAKLMLGVSLSRAGRNAEGLAQVEEVVRKYPNHTRAQKIYESLKRQAGG